NRRIGNGSKKASIPGKSTCEEFSMNKKLIFSVLLCLFSFGSVAGIPVAIDASPEWALEATRWT
ncbi:hypothetical protein OFM93_23500, partial [Escherichia coli]|nr:hypothetical protein [Escherichia coli]